MNDTAAMRTVLRAGATNTTTWSRHGGAAIWGSIANNAAVACSQMDGCGRFSLSPPRRADSLEAETLGMAFLLRYRRDRTRARL